MKKKLSLEQIAANQINSRKSTGPKTSHGRAISKMNALKHGILARDTVVRGKSIKENEREFSALHLRLWEDLAPVGPLEELLVDQIVITQWRARRVIKAEAGEIALNVDKGVKKRRQDIELISLQWETAGDPDQVMSESSIGNWFMKDQLREVRASVEQAGEVTESALQKVHLHGRPYGLTADLQNLRTRIQAELQANPESSDAAGLLARQKAMTLAHIDDVIAVLSLDIARCEEREKKAEEAQRAAALLPAPDVLDKIMRYESRLKRQLYRAMDQLEHVQQVRRSANNSPRANPPDHP
jgi:hypothetical protein